MAEKNSANQRVAERPHPLLRLLNFAGPYKVLTVVGCILSGLHSLLAVMPLVCVWFVMSQFIAVAPNWGEANGATLYAWLAVGFAAAGVLVYFAALMCTHVAAFRTGNNMRKAAIHHLSKVPLGYYDGHSTGELRRIIDGCAAQTESVLAHKFPDFVGALVTPVAFVVVMIIFNWIMGVACLIPIGVSFACIWKMMGGGSGNENSSYLTFVSNYQRALNKMNAAATEYVRGMPVVKVFQQTVDSFNAFKEAILQYRDMAHGYSKLCERPQVIQIVAINATFATLIPASILLAGAEGNFASFLTDFLFYVVFSAITTSMMTKILYASEAIAMAQDAVARIEEILSVPEMPCNSTNNRSTNRAYDIVFENVSFTYPGADVHTVKDASFTIPEGETMALVGPSGGGKSTIASLIPRFWDVDEGRVLVGGNDVRDIPRSRLMDSVSFVFQNTQLFKRSLMDNIRFARPSATRAEVEAAAHAAQCDDIIAKLPDGLDTVVGTKGVYLSGGECQRIALARAILKDAPIVVLDEATAFADPENEVLIQRAFAHLAHGKTVLMIAHRLSTVVGANRICVVENGVIAESGSHEDLLNIKGTYHKMWGDYRKSINWRIGGSTNDVA